MLEIEPTVGARNKTVREFFTDLVLKIAIDKNLIDIIEFTESSELESEEDLLLLLNISGTNDKLETLATQVMEQYKQCK